MADRNQAIDKAIQPMLDMLEQRSQARQQVQAAESEQQKAQLLEQLLPMRVQGAGKDYKEAQAAEKAKATQAGQAKGGKQPSPVPKMQPVNAGDPTTGLGTDAASRLEALVSGGPQPAQGDGGGGMGGGGGGYQSPQAAAQQASGGLPQPGQTVDYRSGSPESTLMQMFRAGQGMPQKAGPAHRIVHPGALELAGRGASMLKTGLVKNPDMDVDSNPAFQAFIEDKAATYGPEVGVQIRNEAVTMARQEAEATRHTRTMAYSTIAKDMSEGGAPEEVTAGYIQALKDDDMGAAVEQLNKYDSSTEIAAKINNDFNRQSVELREMELERMELLEGTRTWGSWVNPLDGLDAAPKPRGFSATMDGLQTAANPMDRVKNAFRRTDEINMMTRQKTGIVNEGTQRSLVGELLFANQELAPQGMWYTYNLDTIAKGEPNPDMRIASVDTLSSGVVKAMLAIDRGGISPAEYFNEYAEGIEIHKELEHAGLEVLFNDDSVLAIQAMEFLDAEAEEPNPYVRDTEGLIGPGMLPFLDRSGLVLYSMGMSALRTGKDPRMMTRGIGATPIFQFEQRLNPEYYKDMQPGIEGLGKAYSGEPGMPSMVAPADTPPIQGLGQPFDEPSAPTPQPKYDYGQLNVTPTETPEWPPPNVVGKSPEARALAEKMLEELSKGAIPPGGDAKIRELLGMSPK